MEKEILPEEIIELPTPMVEELRKHGNPEEIVIEATKKHLEESKRLLGCFEPSQIIETEDVDQEIKAYWIDCLPRPSDYCQIWITGNTIHIQPVQITPIA